MIHVTEFLETTQFFKTLILTSCDNDTQFVAQQLDVHEHSIAALCTSHIDTDRPSFHTRLDEFRTHNVRNFCTSFEIIRQHQIEAEASLMDHDIIILYCLDDDTIDMCMRWLKDARDRGFRNKHSTLYHIIIADHEKILFHKVEQQ